MLRQIKFFTILLLLCSACKIAFITGYDPIIDETGTKLKRDFNVFFIKLSRTIRDSDPENQKFINFQEYYDNMEVDLKILEDRTVSLPKKSGEVKSEISNIKALMFDFRDKHKTGFKDLGDNVLDDHHDALDNINIAINALLKTQEVLKTNGK